MKAYRAVLITAFLSLPAWATPQEDQTFIDHQLDVSSALRNAPPSDYLRSLAAQGQQIMPRAGHSAPPEKPVPQALYFVSFSMPAEGMKALIQDAHRLHIPATLRGLVNNDFRQTANAVLALVKDDHKGGVQIDPTAFKTYGITAVPALVVTCPGHFDRVAGNIALPQALKKVAESGECSDVAEKMLTDAGDKP